MLKRSVLAVVFVLLLSGSALCGSVFLTGNKLLEICQADNIVLGGKCIGYVMGVQDSYAGLDTDGFFQSPYCLPTNVTDKQLTRVAVKYLGDNPEKRHLNAQSLVLDAFIENFPCPK